MLAYFVHLRLTHVYLHHRRQQQRTNIEYEKFVWIDANKVIPNQFLYLHSCGPPHIDERPIRRRQGKGTTKKTLKSMNDSKLHFLLLLRIWFMLYQRMTTQHAAAAAARERTPNTKLNMHIANTTTQIPSDLFVVNCQLRVVLALHVRSYFVRSPSASLCARTRLSLHYEHMIEAMISFFIHSGWIDNDHIGQFTLIWRSTFNETRKLQAPRW